MPTQHHHSYTVLQPLPLPIQFHFTEFHINAHIRIYSQKEQRRKNPCAWHPFWSVVVVVAAATVIASSPPPPQLFIYESMWILSTFIIEVRTIAPSSIPPLLVQHRRANGKLVWGLLNIYMYELIMLDVFSLVLCAHIICFSIDVMDESGGVMPTQTRICVASSSSDRYTHSQQTHIDRPNGWLAGWRTPTFTVNAVRCYQFHIGKWRYIFCASASVDKYCRGQNGSSNTIHHLCQISNIY